MIVYAERCQICGLSVAHARTEHLAEDGGGFAHKRCVERRRLLCMGSPVGPDRAVPIPGHNCTLRIRFVAWKQYVGRTMEGVRR